MKLCLLFTLWMINMAHCDDSHLPPDVEHLLEAIALGKGLYSEYPYIVSLNTSNFNKVATDTVNAWVIEFYNSWCGDCIRFMTTFKRFSADISGWTKDVKVGAVDCFQDINIPICRDFDIVQYPSKKYLPPHYNKHDTITVTAHDEVKLRNEVAGLILKEKSKKFLQPFTDDLRALRIEKFQDKKNTAKRVVLVVECTFDLGPQIILDYRKVSKKMVEVVSVSCNNVGLLKELDPSLRHGPKSTPAIYILSPDDAVSIGVIRHRADALNALRVIFSSPEINAPAPFPLYTIKEIKISLKDALAYAMAHHTIPLRKIPTDKVFRVDIEGALKHTLTNEIPRLEFITGKKLDALKQYLHMQHKYFPIGPNGKKFLSCILSNINEFNEEKKLTGGEFVNTVNSCEAQNQPVFHEKGKIWLGCHGIVLLFRGFPCAMWQMYHTLTIASFKKNVSDPLEVHNGIKAYIENLFGCSNCVQNFLKDASQIPKLVKNLKDSVMWLWKEHNKVNHRLHGDQTEDPTAPKVQFPLAKSCPGCHKPDGGFNESEVLTFLQKMYSHFSNETLSDFLKPKLTSRSLAHQLPYDIQIIEMHEQSKSLYAEENYCTASW